VIWQHQAGKIPPFIFGEFLALTGTGIARPQCDDEESASRRSRYFNPFAIPETLSIL
jgi:hypothetical protein